MDNQLAVLEDMMALFSENQELPENSVQLSNYNSNFLSNRDNSIPQPVTVIHPINLEYKEKSEARKRVEGVKDVEKLIERI